MSIYDSSHSSAGDSDVTKRAKARLENIIKTYLPENGWKSIIKFEVPATFEKKYHGDLGVLMRSKMYFDQYHFFIIEIDDPSHDTFKHENKDYERDEAFHKHGILTIRIKLSKIQGAQKIEKDKDLFNDQIWFHLFHNYLNPVREADKAFALRNTYFAIELAENGKGTQCDSCDHKLVHHDLTGCDYRNTNKAKLKCNCHKPVFRSDE